MATRVQGITIELSADASGLEKALKDVNSALSTTQKELRSVDKALKLDPTNLDLVSQKQRLLQTSIEQTTKKLEALKQAQQQIGESYGTDSSQYSALTREIAFTESRLKNLNTEQQNFRTQANAARYDASSFGQALNSVGQTASEVANKTSALSAAAAAALAGITALTINASKTADNWDTMSQQIGLSTEAIQKFEYASGRVDVDMGTITSAITRMKGQLDSTSGVWDRIGVSVRDQKDEYRDIESIFFDVVRAIGEIENGTERDTVAMELFGRRADDLAGILDDGGKKLRELGDEAENLGLIVSDEDISKLTAFNDVLEQMKAQVKAALVQAAIPALEALAPLIGKVAQVVETIAQALSNLNPAVALIILAILAVISSISPVAQLIANVTVAIRGVMVLLPMLMAGIQAVNAQLLSLLANPVVLTVMGIVAALVLLGVAIYEVVTHWDEIKAATSSAVSAFKNGMNNMVNAVTRGIGKIGAMFPELSSFISEAVNGFASLASSVGSAFNKINDYWSQMKQNAAKAGREIIEAFVNGIKAVINKVISTIQNLANQIKSIWSKSAQDASVSGQQAGRNYASGYQQATTSKLSVIQQASTIKSSSNVQGASYSTAQTNQMMSAIRSLEASISRIEPTPVNMTVELVGSAKDIFSTVRTQNSQLRTATGYHALA